MKTTTNNVCIRHVNEFYQIFFQTHFLDIINVLFIFAKTTFEAILIV